MKIIMISDTHGRHNHLKIPEGDLLIHAGDVSSRGLESEIKNFLEWFSKQPHKYKVFIAGNHDFYFERQNTSTITKFIPEGIIYLNDSGITIDGLNIWGSPIQPEFMDWAFNRKRGSEIKEHWNLIPNNTDILITHGPPHRILDESIRREFTGCEELKKKVDVLKPKLHIFGHIHEAFGVKKIDKTTYVNASQLDYKYYLTNHPLVINLNV